MIFIIGRNSELAKNIISFYKNIDIKCLERSIYQNWYDTNTKHQIRKYFLKYKNSKNIIIITSGVMDNSLPLETHLNVNFLLPFNILLAVSDLDVKVITFGTIMENIISKPNNYIYSKKMLNEKLNQFSFNHVHIQLNTLYGSFVPKKFMFLGQIFNSLQDNTNFSMSNGNQLREYHHVEDDVIAIDKIIQAEINGIINLCHGNCLSLKIIAKSIFSHFKKEELLLIGKIPQPEDENYVYKFKKNPIFSDILFRDTVKDIIISLEKIL